MESDGKIKLLHKSGSTKDIIRACVDEWHNGWKNYIQFSQQLKRATIEATCRAVFNFLIKKIQYRIDPEGKQFIKVPARLMKDGTGDCKSYSILTASVLNCLGIECVMRFVSYDSGDYSHVYVVAFDENGREIKIDAVAFVQCGTIFNEELKYKKKLDMKGTEISRLSGVGDITAISSQEWELFKADFAGGQKMNVINCNAGLFLLDSLSRIGISNDQIDAQYGLFSLAKEIISRFGTNNADLTTAGYVLASYVLSDKYWYTSGHSAQIMSEISSYVSNSVENARFIISDEFQDISADFMDWWESFIVAYNRIADLTANDAEVATNIVRDSPFFLYTVIEDNALSKIALSKKMVQVELLSGYIASSGISYEAALLLVESGIILQSGMSLSDFFQKFKREKNPSIGAFNWDSLSNLVNTAADGFSKVYTTVTSSKDPKAIDRIPGNKPEPSDFNNYNILMAVIGLATLGVAVYALKPKKGKRK